MNDRELEEVEERVRAWYRAEIGAEQNAPSALRANVAAIPHGPSASRWFVGSRRSVGLLAAAAVLTTIVVGGAIGLGGGFFRLPADVPPVPSPTPSQSAPPATAALTPAPTVLLAPIGYGGTGTIAFTRFDRTVGGNATWLIDPDGSHEAALRVGTGWGGATGLPGTGCCAVFSPDGTKVAVGYDEIDPSRGAGTWATTRIVDLGGADVSSIPVVCGGCASIDGIDYVPRAWSPDGALVAIEVWNDADPGRDGINLAPLVQRTPTTQTPPPPLDWDTQVTGAHPDIPVAFSPDSKKLLFIRIKKDDQGTLMALTIEGGAVRQISPAGTLVFANDYFGPAASWSPDGTRIAFAATDPSGDVGQMRAYVVGADRGSPSAITAPTSDLTTARWSPDGTWIAFDRGGSNAGIHDLFVIHPDGSGQTNLTADLEPGICCARWSPDSTALLAAGTATTDDESYLFIVPISGGPIAQVTTVAALYEDFSWGPASR